MPDDGFSKSRIMLQAIKKRSDIVTDVSCWLSADIISISAKDRVSSLLDTSALTLRQHLTDSWLDPDIHTNSLYPHIRIWVRCSERIDLSLYGRLGSTWKACLSHRLRSWYCHDRLPKERMLSYQQILYTTEINCMLRILCFMEAVRVSINEMYFVCFSVVWTKHSNYKNLFERPSFSSASAPRHEDVSRHGNQSSSFKKLITR
jgi:hypothetical protein